MKKKIKLSSIKVSSFVTQMDKAEVQKTLKGGRPQSNDRVCDDGGGGSSPYSQIRIFCFTGVC